MPRYRCKECSWRGAKPEACVYETGPTDDAIGYGIADGICCPGCGGEVEDVTQKTVEFDLNLCVRSK